MVQDAAVRHALVGILYLTARGNHKKWALAKTTFYGPCFVMFLEGVCLITALASLALSDLASECSV